MDSWTGPLCLSLSRAFFRFSLLLRFDFFTLCVLSLSLFSFLRFLSLLFFLFWRSSELLLSLPLLSMSMHLMDSSQRCTWKTCALNLCTACRGQELNGYVKKTCLLRKTLQSDMSGGEVNGSCKISQTSNTPICTRALLHFTPALMCSASCCQLTISSCASYSHFRHPHNAGQFCAVYRKPVQAGQPAVTHLSLRWRCCCCASHQLSPRLTSQLAGK